MESKKINQLATNVNPQTSDLTTIGDPITGQLKKITWLQVANLIGAQAAVTLQQVTDNGNTTTDPITTAGLTLTNLGTGVPQLTNGNFAGTYGYGLANGVATLDSGGKIPAAQLPSSVMEYKGTWNASTNTPTLADGTGDNGDVYLVNVAGSQNLGSGTISFAVGDWVVYNGTIWQKSLNSNAVASVFGRTGTIVAQEGDYNIDQLGDVAITSAATNDYLRYNGSSWVNTQFPTFVSSDKLVLQVRNNSGATINKGTVVYINGATAGYPTIAKALANDDATSAQTIGMVQDNISNNSNGVVVIVGQITGVDTSAYTAGTQLYLSGTTAGTVTSTKPYAPLHLVYVGIVTTQNAVNGVIEVKVQNGVELEELHNVDALNPNNNDGIFYNSTSELWEHKSIATVLGYTPEQPLTFSSPLVRTTNTISIPAATGSVNGYLTSTDWTTFNGKVPYTGATADVDLGFNNFDANQINGFKIVAKLDGTGSSPLILRTGTSGYSYGSDAISLISSPSSANTLTIISDVSSVNKIAQFGLGSLTATRTYTLPDATGTLALTSNIPANIITGTGTNNEIAYFNTTGSTIASLSTAIYPSLTELSYVKGVTSAIQTQLNSKLSAAITSLNGLTAATQTFATGSSGTDFNISSSTSTHTFNIPSASASNRGLVTTGTQTFAGDKTFSGSLNGLTAVFTGSVTTPAGFYIDANTYLYEGILRLTDLVGKKNILQLQASSSGHYITSTFLSGGSQQAIYISAKSTAGQNVIFNTDGTTTFSHAISGTTASFTSNSGNFNLGSQTDTAIYTHFGSKSASGGQAVAMRLAGTLTATANFDNLFGLWVDYTDNAAGYTGVVRYGIYQNDSGKRNYFGGPTTFNSVVTVSDTVTATAFIPSGTSVPSRGMYTSASNVLDFSAGTTNLLSLNYNTGLSTFNTGVKGSYFRIVNVSTAEFGINTENNQGYIGTTTSHGFNIMTNNTPRLTFHATTGAATFSSSVYASRGIFDSDFLQNETSKVGISFASGYAQINSWGANTTTYGGIKLQLSVSNGATVNALTIAPTGAASFSSSVTAGSSSATNYGTLQIMGGSTSASLTVGTAANTVLAFSPGQELAITGNSTAPYGITFQGRNSLAGGGASGTSYPIIFNPLGGNVGIGTASPSFILDVNDTNASGVRGLRISTSSSTVGPGLFLYLNNGLQTNWVIGNSYNISNALEFISSNSVGGNPGTAGTARMIITKDGNMLFNGTSDPGGIGNIYIGNTGSVPGTPSGGGVLYVQGGALKFKGSSGTITTIANA